MIPGRFLWIPAIIAMQVRSAAAQTSADTTRLGDLVVTATRQATPSSAIPAATTVLRGDDLRSRGIALVLDALREVPGIGIVQSGSYGAQTSIFLRGGESNYVKVFLDGVPLNRPGGGINLANLTTADLDRIEIVRGPASVLYGADAMTGVIQLFTRGAGGHGSAELSGRGGTFGASEFTGHVDVVAKNGWLFGVTGSRLGSNGTYAFNSGYRNAVGSMQLGIDRGSSGRGVLTLRYGDGIAHFPTNSGGQPVDQNQFTTEKSLAAGLDTWWPIAGDGSLHVQGFASRLNEGYNNRSDTPADTTGFNFIDDRTIVTWRRGVDLRLDRRNSSGVVSIGVGLEHETDDEHDIGVSNFGFGISHDTSGLVADRTTRNAYLQVLSAPDAKVSTQLGVRLDNNSAFGTFKTWRVGATWHVSELARIWVGAGTAFKAPTFLQLFARSPFEVGNAALMPEQSRNTEVGFETRSQDQRVTVGATAFWQHFSDLIHYVSAASGQPTYVNLGGVDSRGIEATISGKLAAGVAVNAHWTWLHTAVTDTGSASSLVFTQGARLIRRPASSGGATLTYHWRGLTVAATATRVGERDDVDFSGFPGARVILPGYTTMDLAVEAPLHRGAGRSAGVSLTLRGENLFNVAYQQTVGFPGRSRALFAGAGLRF